MLKIVLIVNVTTAPKLDNTVVVIKILLVCNVLEEIILESINFKYNPLVGKKKLEVKISIT